MHQSLVNIDNWQLTCHSTCPYVTEYVSSDIIDIECQINARSHTVGTPDPNIEEMHCCHYLQGRTRTRTRQKTCVCAPGASYPQPPCGWCPRTTQGGTCESFGHLSTFAAPSCSRAGFPEGSFLLSLAANMFFFGVFGREKPLASSQVLRDWHLWAFFNRWGPSWPGSLSILMCANQDKGLNCEVWTSTRCKIAFLPQSPWTKATAFDIGDVETIYSSIHHS